MSEYEYEEMPELVVKQDEDSDDTRSYYSNDEEEEFAGVAADYCWPCGRNGHFCERNFDINQAYEQNELENESGFSENMEYDAENEEDTITTIDTEDDDVSIDDVSVERVYLGGEVRHVIEIDDPNLQDLAIGYGNYQLAGYQRYRQLIDDRGEEYAMIVVSESEIDQVRDEV